MSAATEDQRALELFREMYDLEVLSLGKDHPALAIDLDGISGLFSERDSAEVLRSTERAVAQARATSVSTTVRADLHLARARVGDRTAAAAFACLVDALLPREGPDAERTRQRLRAHGLPRRPCR